MSWWRKKPQAPTGSATEGRLVWALEAHGDETVVTATLREPIPGAEFPHLYALVLVEPHAGALPEGWEAGDLLVGTQSDGSEIEVHAPYLYVPVRNLCPGETFRTTAPVPIDQVAGVVFGSLTNRLWVETDDDHLWLVNHDRTPTLHDEWHDQFGTPVREAARERLVVADGTLRLEPAPADP